MIFNALLTFTDNTVGTFLNSLPFTMAPDFFYTTLPEIFEKIMAFNDYLPIYELSMTALICLTATFAWKIIKVVASIIPIFDIDLGA